MARMTKSNIAIGIILLGIFGLITDVYLTLKYFDFNLTADLYQRNDYILASDFDNDGIFEKVFIEKSQDNNLNSLILVITSQRKELIRIPISEGGKKPLDATRIAINPSQDKTRLLIIGGIPVVKNVYEYNNGRLELVEPNQKDEEIIDAIYMQANSYINLYMFFRYKFLIFTFIILIIGFFIYFFPKRKISGQTIK